MKREGVPTHVSPMLAVLSTLPVDEGAYGFEYKWDGIRAIAFWDGRKVRLETRNGIDVTMSYPELTFPGESLLSHAVVLDGEIVAMDEEGRPSFNMLQHRMGLLQEGAIAGRMREVPVTFLIFDILHLDGYSTMDVPYRERRFYLEELEISTGHWMVPPYHTGEGEAMLLVARDQGLEGVMAKRLEGVYQPGQRSREWRKIKIVHRQEFVIGGWMPGSAGGEGVGSLLVGYNDITEERAARTGKGPRLIYAGKVGTGFTERDRVLLRRFLEKKKRPESPFEGSAGEAAAYFVEPDIVADVEFRGWTSDWRLRQPSFKGIRPDKAPGEVIRE